MTVILLMLALVYAYPIGLFTMHYLLEDDIDYYSPIVIYIVGLTVYSLFVVIIYLIIDIVNLIF